MIETIAAAIVVIAGIYFIALGVSALLVPAFAKRFLLGFAGSPRAHYAELLARFMVGGAFLMLSPGMLFSSVFHVGGWVLIATTAALLLVPWHWHRRFADYAVPRALRYITLIGLCSLLLGGAVLVALVRGADV